MKHSTTHNCIALLSGLLLGIGCGSNNDPVREEVSIEELNAALAYLEQSGQEPPGSVHELTNLAALQGKVLPTLPEGQYFSIDTDKNQVIIETDRLPDMPDSFPHKGPY